MFEDYLFDDAIAPNHRLFVQHGFVSTNCATKIYHIVQNITQRKSILTNYYKKLSDFSQYFGSAIFLTMFFFIEIKNNAGIYFLKNKPPPPSGGKRIEN